MNATLPGSSLRDFSRVLSCFAKIGDDVALELLLSTLNASKSAFILVTLNATRFERFEYVPLQSSDSGLRCRVQLRALMSIFRSRNIEVKEGREAAVEKCELKLLHPSKDDSSECQFLIRLVCRHGVRKTYKLQYESCHTMHAVVDRTKNMNHFTLSARAWKDVTDHFAPRAEEITLACEAGNLLLTSFTEAVRSDKEILKQPVHTSVTVDNKEFDEIDVDDGQVTFGLREFKAVGVLCDLLNADISVSFAQAGRPLLVEFDKDGMIGEFVVATTDDGERTDNAGLERQSASQYQPRSITSRPRRTKVPAQRSPERPEPPRYRRTPSPTADESNAFENTALFAPDPDEQDETVQAQHARLRKPDTTTYSHDETQDDQSMRQVPHEYDEPDAEDEMQLYADEQEYAGLEEELELGPTQTQTINKHRGLFD